MNLASLFVLPTLLISLVFNPVFGEDFPVDEHPIYQGGILTIPRVDTSDQVGKFQDVKLLLTEQGDWRLIDVKIPLAGLYVETVQTVVTETFPFQVFLKVNGSFSNGCITMGQIAQRMKANRFEIVMYDQNNAKQPEETCTAALVPFEKIIPLSVYGLSAGTYEYSLSGVRSLDAIGTKTFTGTFNIPRDNKF